MSTTAFKVVKSVLRSPLCKCRLNHAQVVRSGRILSNYRRCYSTEPLPVPNEENKSYSPKIQQIVNDISQLSLLEVADLNDLLKKTLKIADAPVMAVGAAGPAAAAAPPEEEDEVAQAPQKSLFNVKLTGFEADKKIALIKEIKNIVPGTNLVQAKKIVESMPVVLKKDLTKEEAEELVKALEAVGAKLVTE